MNKLPRKHPSVIKRFGLFLSIAVALGAWVYASPVGSAPDDGFHLTSIWCGSGFKDGKCEPAIFESKKRIPNTVMVPKAVALANGCPGGSGVPAYCALDLLRNQQMWENSHNNSDGWYPSGYYYFASKFVSDNVGSTVLLLRWINVLLFSFLVVAANILLAGDLRKSFNLSHIIILMPLGLFTVSSNNPSSWTIIGVGTYWAFLYGFLTMSKLSRVIPAGVLSLFSAMVAIQSRPDAGAYVVVTTLVVVSIVYARKVIEFWVMLKRLWLPIMILVFITAMSSPALEKFQGLSPYLGNPRMGFDINPILSNITRLPYVLVGIFGFGSVGSLGWLDVQMPEIVSMGMLFLFASLVSNAFSKRSTLEVLILSIFAISICSIILSLLYKSDALVGAIVQSRYVLPIIIPLVGLYFSGSAVVNKISESKTLKNMTATLLIVSYVVALHTTIRRYVTGDGVVNWNLDSSRKWWWDGVPPPMTMLLLGSIAYAIVVGTVVYGNQKVKSTPIGLSNK